MKYLITLVTIIFIGLGIFFYLRPKEPIKDILFKVPVETSAVEVLNNDKKAANLESPISIKYLRSLKIESDSPVIERVVAKYPSYNSYLVYYYSEGSKVYGLLTIPNLPIPEGGFPAIVFNHGYIPPKSYSTFNNYPAYVDYLARNGFVVFKIDMRGHGNSEGVATGGYFSSTYTKDAIAALKSLQKLENVNKNKIGIWGHSMSGNLVLRAMEVEKDFKAGVIWAGAVYSYEDFYDLRITDSSYSSHLATQPSPNVNRDDSLEISKFRNRSVKPDFNNEYWKSISLTANLNYLESPIQIHHSVNDEVVSINYSRKLSEYLKQNNKNFEYFEYSGGGHNISGVYFNQAMERTVKFFKDKLN